MADMTTLVYTNSNTGHSAISTAFYRMVVALSDWRADVATRRELNKLSDTVLEDIGLSRGDITALNLPR
jgi:uncharacterized protein YjiS (DUF1127 family)